MVAHVCDSLHVVTGMSPFSVFFLNSETAWGIMEIWTVQEYLNKENLHVWD